MCVCKDQRPAFAEVQKAESLVFSFNILLVSLLSATLFLS